MSLRGFATLNIWADDVAGRRGLVRRVPRRRALLLPARAGRTPGVHRVPDRRLPADELGIIDRRYAPPGRPPHPAG